MVRTVKPDAAEPAASEPSQPSSVESLCEEAYEQSVTIIRAAMKQPGHPFGAADASGRQVPGLAIPDREVFIADCERMPVPVRRCWVQDFSQNAAGECREMITAYLREQG